MERRSATEPLSVGSERQIRRLRFADPEQERAFRNEYAEKARRQVRFIMAAMLPVQLLAPVFGAVTNPGLMAHPLFWLMGVEGVALTLGGFWLTYSRHFLRFSQ